MNPLHQRQLIQGGRDMGVAFGRAVRSLHTADEHDALTEALAVSHRLRDLTHVSRSSTPDFTLASVLAGAFAQATGLTCACCIEVENLNDPTASPPDWLDLMVTVLAATATKDHMGAAQAWALAEPATREGCGLGLLDGLWRLAS